MRNAAALREPLRASAARSRADEVARGEQPPAWRESDMAEQRRRAYVEWLMDRDRKSPGLKLLQGRSGSAGYRAGTLKGEVFADVPPALRRWRDAGLDVAIYSSGSELAQRLLFGTTAIRRSHPVSSPASSTRPSGRKGSADSYRRIARELGCATGDCCSSRTSPGSSTRHATPGCDVLLCVRPGNAAQPGDTYPVVRTFDEIVA